SSSSEANPSQSDSQVKYEPKSYHCVICGVSGFSTLERSFVQMVLLQSTSILGNAQAHTLSEEISGTDCSSEQASSSTAQRPLVPSSHIPTSDDEFNFFGERKTFADYFEQRVDTSCNTFATDSWLSSFNIGWQGGVHTQSCGHFMHMDCFQ